MNILLLETSDFITENTVRISDERFTHIQKILNAQKDDTLKAGLLNGKLGLATVTELSSNSIELTTLFNEEPPNALPLTVILAMPRPKMLKRILSNIAEFGVKEVYLINSYKVEKSFWQTPVLQDIDTYLKQGLTQTKDTILPKVYCKKLFRPFVEDELPEIIQGKEAYVAHPYHASPCPTPSTEQRIIIIGPEGGFIPFEIELLQTIGCKTISMGERIYKVENALSILCHQMSTPD